jgi:hypothetical protein
MTRVLVLSAFALSLAGMGVAQQTGESTAPIEQQQQQYSTPAQPMGGQYSWQPYSTQYGAYGAQGWQTSPYAEQYRPYMQYNPYAQYNPYTFEQQYTSPWYARQFAQPSPWQYTQPSPWQFGWQGTYSTTGYPTQPTGWFGQQGYGAMGWSQGQRARVVGMIQQNMPAQQFSNELNPNDTLINVRTISGREVLVDLGPAGEAADFSPTPGTRVVVTGHIVYLNGQPVLVARFAHELGAGMFQQTGFGERFGTTPAWEAGEEEQACGEMGQGQQVRVLGAIQQHIPAQQFSSELNPNDVLVSVRTLSGREQLVDLGPGADTATFAPNPGTRVFVTGHITCLNGQPLLIAQRAHELGAGIFRQAGYGERAPRFHQYWQSRAGM